MANNVPSRKPSNVISTRISYKPIKLEASQLQRNYQQATIVSVNAKDANKDKDKEKDRKLRLPGRRASSNPKHQLSKRLEVVDQLRVPAAATAAPAATTAPPAAATAAPAAAPAVLAKVPINERTVVLAKHADQLQQVKQTRKPKLEEAVLKAKAVRATVAETALAPSKHAKEAKSKDKAEAAAIRQMRTKNQSHNTKIFFDKYLKFAYDLSTPDGVRQLEAHFFPAEALQSKIARKKNDSGDFSEKQHFPDDKCSGINNKHIDPVDQAHQQSSKCCENV